MRNVQTHKLFCWLLLSSSVLLGSCAILDQEDREFGVLVGGQSGAPGDLGHDYLPALGMELVGDTDLLGAQGVFGVHLSNGTEDIQVGGVPIETDLQTWSVTAGLRRWPGEWSHRVRPFGGLGLSYLDVNVDSSLPSAGDQGLGVYAELGIESGPWSLRWRRVGGSDMELGAFGSRSVDLNQILLGWSTGF